MVSVVGRMAARRGKGRRQMGIVMWKEPQMSSLSLSANLMAVLRESVSTRVRNSEPKYCLYFYFLKNLCQTLNPIRHFAHRETEYPDPSALSYSVRSALIAT